MTGYVQVYTGDGKGKTTAAVGLTIRACGAGLRVFFGQFMKNAESSEIHLINERCPEVTTALFGCGGFIIGEPAPEDIAAAHRGLDCLLDAVGSGTYDLVVADEVNVALAKGLLELSNVLAIIDMKAAATELVLTGRGAAPEVIARADLVSEIRPVKHYFDKGVPARQGIEK